ncbi:MAG: UDP-N-acetylmuramoyl-tripeptide--D-alanyl-D-alanine ligase [Rubrivivax sp.]
MMTLHEALACLPGARLVGDPDVRFERVHTDTRSLRSGDLFVALRGERFDAHDFLPQARSAGAAAALAERGLSRAGLPGLELADSLKGLQTLAAAWRQRFAGPLLAVTGSNGKTTVTQMAASILRAAHGDAALATTGNLNIHIGVPLTLLRLREHHRVAVLELGMNHPGEIALLAGLARPTVALVNNAQREHQEFMASVAAVAQENGRVIEALPADGVAVFPADDAHTVTWRQMAGRRQRLTFAVGAPADVTARHEGVTSDGAWEAELITPHGSASVRVAAPGRHNLKNAVGAAAATLAAGIPMAAVVQGLADFKPVSGRSQLNTLRWAGRQVALVDDTYNANPDSMLAAIDVLASLPAPQWLILGDMGEVGQQGPAFHREVGQRAQERGITHLWCAGIQSVQTAHAYGRSARHFASTEMLVEALMSGVRHWPASASVLVKGSRFMAMERAVQALRDTAQADVEGNT